MKKKNNVVKVDNQIISIISKSGDAALIKPLVKEIMLFNSYISGTSEIFKKTMLSTLNIGQKLNLRKEINKFDESAIAVYADNKVKIGYVFERDSAAVSRLMDAGKSMIAKITSINRKGEFSIIHIDIYLLDY